MITFKGLFSKKKWNVVGRSEITNLWTVTKDNPQVKCRLLLKEDQFGNRDYELDMLDVDSWILIARRSTI